jgi:ABC-2 type transport system ATP-binding protein
MSKSTDDIAIKVSNVSKSFKLPHEKSNSIKSSLINFRKKQTGYETQQVLKNISFEVKKGEFFGIVGRNGSGKSTLLKIISQIYSPDSGEVTVNGRLTPFIELGVGFNPELSGRDNIFLNGALLGFSRKQMDAMYDDIVAFAELERFMDQKLKNYSSGMQVRLAFSIAIKAESDILVLDEVLAVGDESFQRKCFDYFGSLKKRKKTVVLVTHDMAAVERFCTRAMLVEAGKISEVGKSSHVAQKYRSLFVETMPKNKKTKDTGRGVLNPIVKAVSTKVASKGERAGAIAAKDAFNITMTIMLSKPIKKAVVGINVLNSTGAIVLGMGYGGLNEQDLSLKQGENVLIFVVENILTDDRYVINAAIEERDTSDTGVLVYQDTEVADFLVTGTRSRRYAIAHPQIKNIREK